MYAAIDHHICCRQGDLQLERKCITHDWSMRVNLTLLEIYIVDAWMLYMGAREAAAGPTQAEFYEDLAAQLIQNTSYNSGYRSRAAPADVPREDVGGLARYGVGLRLVPTLKREGGDARLAQRDCRVWKQNCLSFVCSHCRKTGDGTVFCCWLQFGRNCFQKHIEIVHDLDVQV